MTAANGYLWFLPSWFDENWYDTEKWNRQNSATESVPCSKAEMIEAINGHMSLSYKFFADNDSITQDHITVAEWHRIYRENLRSDVSYKIYILKYCSFHIYVCFNFSKSL